jgi:hypothetical protein
MGDSGGRATGGNGDTCGIDSIRNSCGLTPNCDDIESYFSPEGV